MSMMSEQNSVSNFKQSAESKTIWPGLGVGHYHGLYVGVADKLCPRGVGHYCVLARADLQIPAQPQGEGCGAIH